MKFIGLMKVLLNCFRMAIYVVAYVMQSIRIQFWVSSYHLFQRLAMLCCPPGYRPIQVLDDGDIWGLGAIWLADQSEMEQLGQGHRPAWVMRYCPERVFEI